jgi:hypothetical protein
LPPLLFLQEKEAAAKRADADLEKARAEAELEHLQRSLSAMEEARAARQEALKMQLAKQKLEKEVALQVRWCVYFDHCEPSLHAELHSELRTSHCRCTV